MGLKNERFEREFVDSSLISRRNESSAVSICNFYPELIFIPILASHEQAAAEQSASMISLRAFREK